MKYGFEVEAFVTKKGELVLAREVGLPYDEGGLLAEARGEPSHCPLLAAFLLAAEVYKLKKRAREKRLKLLFTPIMEVEQTFFDTVIRRYGKGPVPAERGSMYGKEYLGGTPKFRAGLHVHFSDSYPITNKENREIHVHRQIDIPKLVRKLDLAFEKDILATGRLSGLYELKPSLHGGFEYRSLPNDVNPIKVAEALGE